MTYQLYLGDCLDFMHTLDAGSVDAVVTDPPYGVGADHGKQSGTDRTGFYKSAFRKTYSDAWDIRPDDSLIIRIADIAKIAIIWGGNYFAHALPSTQHWLVWDKMNTMPTFSDCELAWTNVDRSSVKKFTLSGNGLMAVEKDRVHPTQKPIPLMRWCIENYTKMGDTIFDPFMGSGTTGVACMQLGRNFIGCEIDPGYYAIAEKRIKDAAAQPPLFTLESPEEKPEQAEMW